MPDLANLRKLGSLLPYLVVAGLAAAGHWWLGVSFWGHDKGGMAGFPAVAWFLGSLIAGLVLHELGHALAMRLMGGTVQSIELGGRLSFIRFRVGKTEVSVGLGLGGQVKPGPPELPLRREAFVLVAGPLVNVLMAPGFLLLPIPRPDATRIALFLLTLGLANLAPGRLYGENTTDGWKLLFLRQRYRASAQARELASDPDWYDRPDAFDVLVRASLYCPRETLAILKDLRDRLEIVPRLFRQPWPLPPAPPAGLPLLVGVLTFSVVEGGEVPAEIADLAAERAEWAVKHANDGSWEGFKNKAEARVVLAAVRLRQGRLEEAEQLGAKALKSEELDPDDRAVALATVAMARHARLLPARAQLDEALRLDPDSAMVSEAARFLADQEAAENA